jgi:hypothetical protein
MNKGPYFLMDSWGYGCVARMGLSPVRHESLVPIKSLVAKDAVNCLGNAVGIRAQAFKQDSELGRLVNLGSLHSLQCNTNRASYRPDNPSFIRFNKCHRKIRE